MKRKTVIAAALALAVLVAVVAAGCGGGGGGGATSSPSASAGGAQTGGVLMVGMQTANGEYDPALFAGNIADIMLQAQILEKLVTLGQDFTVQPTLATEWSSADGKVWKFTLRDGVKFSNGQPFTADDVVYTMDRLRDKKLGSAMVGIYANIADITADDPTHVTFTLKSVDTEFPASLTDYHTLMLSKSVTDPAKEIVGTGPFTLESFKAEDRAILKKNPDYWGSDEQGAKLPYLDEVDFIYSPDIAGQVQGLQGGSLNFVGGLTAELKQAVEGNTSLKTIETETNYCFELQIRCDQGLGKNLKFRQALLAGTDRQAIVDLVAPGMAVPGNGTLVGPAFKADYLEDPGTFDMAKAKQLLSESGVKNPQIKLVTQTSDVVPAIATAWQAQMKTLGVTVDIQQVPPDVFYADKGADNWYKSDFGIVDYGTRAVPYAYFQLALITGGAYNYSRWSDANFDKVAKAIPLELDPAKRAELYKQAQTIILDQVPMMNFLVNKAVAGESANVDGIALAPDWPQTLLVSAHFTK